MATRHIKLSHWLFDLWYCPRKAARSSAMLQERLCCWTSFSILGAFDQIIAKGNVSRTLLESIFMKNMKTTHGAVGDASVHHAPTPKEV